MSAYYNEYEPKAAAWLRQLIKNGLIADGEVDERSITEVEASDIRGYTQHHFFAGIGGWSYALRLASWADDKPVCTASLPCQPFSVAGAGKGKDDERHLLPHFIELVKQSNFRTIFGEQVPAAIKHGWLDDLCFEMERENYVVGSIVLTAAGAGAPHIRQRLYWVADSNGTGPQKLTRKRGELQRFTENGMAYGMADTESDRRNEGTTNGTRGTERDNTEGESGRIAKHGGMVYPNGTGSQQGREFTEATGYRDSTEPTGGISRMGNTEHNGRPTSEGPGSDASAIYNSEARANIPSELKGAGTPALVSERTNSEWLYCRDDKWRPIKPGVKPLVDGVPSRVVPSSDRSTEALEIDCENTQEARVMRLKGYGNAIVPQVAAQFIKAFMSV